MGNMKFRRDNKKLLLWVYAIFKESFLLYLIFITYKRVYGIGGNI